MDLENFKPEWIRALNDVGKQLQNITVAIPSADEQQKAKHIIERILPPADQGYVTMEYTRNVLIALEYAKTHYRCSLLDDIKEGRKYDISDYKWQEEEFHEKN